MVRKKLVTLGDILVFWGALPGILAALAAWGERAFGRRLDFRGRFCLTEGIMRHAVTRQNVSAGAFFHGFYFGR